jgi:hypothetical protein
LFEQQKQLFGQQLLHFFPQKHEMFFLITSRIAHRQITPPLGRASAFGAQPWWSKQK